MPDYTQDYLLDKQIKIFQPENGYRASSDAVFLSSLISRLSPGEQILDVGSGTGAVSLCLARRFPQNQIIGLEIQSELAHLSTLSAAANGFDNLRYINCDIRQPLTELSYGSFHHVITNPPYTDHDMPSPNPGKATAHNHHDFSLSEWISFCLKMLRPQGWLHMVHRAEAIGEILFSLHGKAGAITIVPLFSKNGQPAKRLLISTRKNVKTPATILPGIVVHTSDGNYSAEAHRILRCGESLIKA